MPSLVTRFHILIFSVTVAMGAVGFLRIPEGFLFPVHWHGSGADWLWPRDDALVVAPLLQLGLLLAFYGLGRLMTANHLAKTRHIFDPALTLLLTVPAMCQLGLLFIGVGSDLDLLRFTGFGLAAVLLLLGVVLFSAERHSYGGLRMPWPIQSEQAWVMIHRVSGVATGLTGTALAALAWSDPGPGLLVLAFAASLVGLPLLAGLVTLAMRRI